MAEIPLRPSRDRLIAAGTKDTAGSHDRHPVLAETLVLEPVAHLMGVADPPLSAASSTGVIAEPAMSSKGCEVLPAGFTLANLRREALPTPSRLLS